SLYSRRRAAFIDASSLRVSMWCSNAWSCQPGPSAAAAERTDVQWLAPRRPLHAGSRSSIIFTATPLAEAGFCPVTRFPSATLNACQGAVLWKIAPDRFGVLCRQRNHRSFGEADAAAGADARDHEQMARAIAGRGLPDLPLQERLQLLDLEPQRLHLGLELLQLILVHRRLLAGRELRGPESQCQRQHYTRHISPRFEKARHDEILPG